MSSHQGPHSQCFILYYCALHYQSVSYFTGLYTSTIVYTEFETDILYYTVYIVLYKTVL